MSVLTLFFALLVAITASATVSPTQNYCGILGVNGPSGPLPPPLSRKMTLSHSSVVIRHGDRLPSGDSASACWPGAVWTCPTGLSVPSLSSYGNRRMFRKIYDAGDNIFAGDCIEGSLTEIGLAQHTANGVMFRKYAASAGLVIDPSRVVVRGDTVPRVQASAEALVRALLAEVDPSNATAITYHTMDILVDPIAGPNDGVCPNYTAAVEAPWRASQEWSDHFQNVTLPLLGRIYEATGINLTAAGNTLTFFDCLQTHLCHGFAIPSGVDQTMYDDVVSEATWHYKKWAFPTREVSSQNGIGPLIAEIFGSLQAFSVAPDTAPNFVLFSAHDDTLAALKLALGLWEGVWPPYASYLAFEGLIDQDSNMWIRVINDGQILIPETPVEEFLNGILAPLTPPPGTCRQPY